MHYPGAGTACTVIALFSEGKKGDTMINWEPIEYSELAQLLA
jgi:hypothetical protein